ncbi:MAG: hypothetical protein SFV81_13030 [Pirellulaceae bacterium]|nr:hypothetical protein [Pirellulaceae bacterium]
MKLMFDAFTKAGDWLSGWFRTWSASESTADADVCFETEDVDWVGGPLDGLCRPVDTAEIWHLPPIFEVPISPARLECPTERESQLNKGLTSIALYELKFDAGRWFYRFDHSVAPTVKS